MTLPFRRRHHDAEASHDRARAIWTAAMLALIEPDDEAWLDRHLQGCGECRVDRERYLADRDLLRSLRATPPQPPRDLWARTAAAIEREATRGSRPGRQTNARGTGLPFQRVPVGAASGLLVVVVVVGAALLSRGTIVIPPLATAGPSDAAQTAQPAPTPLLVTAAAVRWLRAGDDGSYEVIVADIDAVCPGEDSTCPNLEQSVQVPLKLGGRPIGVTLSPVRSEIVVISAPEDGQPSKIIVVTVPDPTPDPTPTGPPITPSATVRPTDRPSDLPTIEPTDAPTDAPTESPSASPALPSSEPVPNGTREIASDVVVVGDAVYSPDGQWLAFSARPSDRSVGPDLYLWRAGSDEAAIKVTDDHRTYFSSWLGGQVLASRVEIESPEPAASSDPDESAAPPDPDASAAPPDPGAEPTAGAIGEPGVAPVDEGRPISFLLDPETLTVTDLAVPDVWLPVVDPTGKVVVYWSGTVAPANDGTEWLLADGSVVLDRWTGVAGAAIETDAPLQTEVPSEAPGDPGESVGPAGEATSLTDGPLAAFDARFDPDGGRLGLWTLERPDAEHGRLQLLILDPEHGTIDVSLKPLQGVPALRGFSMREGRLAWVTPPGQDGRQSSVQVLAWKDRSFGHVETIPAQDLLVLR